eukprot:4640182-Amphidinium_carterae.1
MPQGADYVDGSSRPNHGCATCVTQQVRVTGYGSQPDIIPAKQCYSRTISSALAAVPTNGLCVTQW